MPVASTAACGLRRRVDGLPGSPAREKPGLSAAFQLAMGHPEPSSDPPARSIHHGLRTEPPHVLHPGGCLRAHLTMRAPRHPHAQCAQRRSSLSQALVTPKARASCRKPAAPAAASRDVQQQGAHARPAMSASSSSIQDQRPTRASAACAGEGASRRQALQLAAVLAASPLFAADSLAAKGEQPQQRWTLPQALDAAKALGAAAGSGRRRSTGRRLR